MARSVQSPDVDRRRRTRLACSAPPRSMSARRMHQGMHITLLWAVVLVESLLGAVGDHLVGPRETSTTSPEPYRVWEEVAITETTIHVISWGFANIGDASISVQLGDTVRWALQEPGHDVVSGSPHGSPDGEFGSPAGVDGYITDEWSYTFDAVGIYPYYCSPHATMVATITVVTASPTPPAPTSAPAEGPGPTLSPTPAPTGASHSPTPAPTPSSCPDVPAAVPPPPMRLTSGAVPASTPNRAEFVDNLLSDPSFEASDSDGWVHSALAGSGFHVSHEPTDVRSGHSALKATRTTGALDGNGSTAEDAAVQTVAFAASAGAWPTEVLVRGCSSPIAVAGCNRALGCDGYSFSVVTSHVGDGIEPDAAPTARFDPAATGYHCRELRVASETGIQQVTVRL